MAAGDRVRGDLRARIERQDKSAPRTYDRLGGLPLRIEGYSIRLLSYTGPDGSTRLTTVFSLEGGGFTGVGEDVCWNDETQLRQERIGARLDLDGEWVFDDFSSHLSELDIFYGQEPKFAVYRNYRRWAIESAALDLALQQVGLPLHAVLEREPRPVRFGVSFRLGEPPSFAPVADRLAAYGDVRFKLDAEPSWDDDLIRALADTGAVDVLDFKGTYRGTEVEVRTDAEFYSLCAEAFPNAYLEDPDLTSSQAVAALVLYADRITWDVPILSVNDAMQLSVRPPALNCKPSRFGAVAALLDFYDWCAREGVALYGGGQAELGPGRGQIQLLASLYHPDGPNDVAPAGWDKPDFPRHGLPTSPLDPAPAKTGFRRASGS